MPNHLIPGWGAGACALALAQAISPAAAEQAAGAAQDDALQRRVEEQAREIEMLKRLVNEQAASLLEVRRAMGVDRLATQRGTGFGAAPAAAAVAQATAAQDATQQQQQQQQPVGQAPDRDNRALDVAPIFEQPGVLTPKGKLTLEPSLQYSYSSSNRVALVGYTIIPAILIGVIDVREVKRNTFTAALTARYGLTNRFEVEARVPYVYRSDTSVGREILQGSASSTAFDASGSNIGDIELTGRYQFNDGGLDKPYYIGSLRFKSRTGRDPFEVETDTSILGLRDGVQTSLPTGSGFYGLQPAITVLYPSDPAVLFGSVSYLYSFKRDGIQRRTSDGPQDLGSIQPGGVWGFNFGMGVALNERSSFSIGYDHSSVGKTKQNGRAAADSVRVQLGTLLLGYSYRLNSQRTLNVSIGAGLTRDTPDVTLTVRVPMTL
ncbi:acetate kinase [Aquincola sp. MAHUQ-54]|uniref:Acetate kinase n=1 Tax=Aquincola agrisoli TaxID=3119538 RepID=A0AAW9QGY9_9BURK